MFLLAILLLASTPENPDEADRVALVQRIKDDFIAAHGDRPIVSTKIVGLERTRSVVVEQWLPSTGQLLSECDLARSYEEIYRLGIFSEVRFDLEPVDGGAALSVAVDERWTLYPVPMLWFFRDTQVGGLVVVDSNAFGKNKGWALGGLYSNRGWYTMAAYVDPNIAFTNLWGKIDLFVGAGIVENDSAAGMVQQSFDQFRTDVQYQVGTTFWGRFSPTLTGAFRWGDVERIRVPGMELPVSSHLYDQGIKLIYSDRKYRFYYDEGLRLSLEYLHGFSFGDRDTPFDSLVWESAYARPAFGRTSIDVAVYATWADLPIMFEDRLGGFDGSRTLPTGFIAADRFVSSMLAYQIPVVAGRIGTVAAVVFGEAGVYARNAEPATSYFGPGGGVRFYLRNISVPAFGGDVGYEMRTGSTNFSIVIGYRPPR